MLFRSYRKRKALQSYRAVLGRRLRGIYGRRDHYEPDDVVATARTYNLSETYLCYALAMYCERAAFDAYHAERGDAACSFVRLSHELGALAPLHEPGVAGVAEETGSEAVADAAFEVLFDSFD